MDVRLIKQIPLKTAEVYLSLEKEVKRTDIQRYLSGQKFDNPVIENRVRQYLRTKGILDESGCSTLYGNTVKETGMVKEREEGKYRIWYTQGDDFLENRIFYFQRVQPNIWGKDEKIEQLKINFDKVQQFCLPVTENKVFDFKVLPAKNDYYPMCLKSETDVIQCTWQWQEMKTSFFNFSGTIARTPIKDHKKDGPAAQLSSIISRILPEWDKEHSRYKIHFDKINESSRNEFEYTYNRNNAWNGFDVHITALPLEPLNTEEAVQWRNWLVNQTLREKYLHPNDFADTVRAANDKEGFAAYTGALTQASPSAEEYRETITPSKPSDKGAMYWHLSAPLDLNPGMEVNHG